MDYLLYVGIFLVSVTFVYSISSRGAKKPVLIVPILVLLALAFLYLVQPFGTTAASSLAFGAVIIVLANTFLDLFFLKVTPPWYVLVFVAVVLIVLCVSMYMPLGKISSQFKEVKQIPYSEYVTVFKSITDNSALSPLEKVTSLMNTVESYEQRCDALEYRQAWLQCYSFGELYVAAVEGVGRGAFPSEAEKNKIEQLLCRSSFADYYYVGGRWIKDGNRSYLKEIGSTFDYANELPSWPKCDRS